MTRASLTPSSITSSLSLGKSSLFPLITSFANYLQPLPFPFPFAARLLGRRKGAQGLIVRPLASS